jgi:hypothetical protein
MDWFRDLTGFVEDSYESTRSRLRVEGNVLRSLVNNRSFHVGELTTPSLGELRALVASGSQSAKPRITSVYGDVRELHRSSEYAGSLFQVASQFNLLEMVDPSVTPEHGVTRYQFDHTQGPACAIAAGAATIYRNYFVPIANYTGQTADRQLDMLAELGASLAEQVGRPLRELYVMKNGYAMASREGLIAIGAYLASCPETERDRLRSLLRIGLHTDVEVTSAGIDQPPRVSQVFSSALPVAYCRHEPKLWEPFARLILEATYEATLLAGVVSSQRSGSRIVSLTRVGGGAFGNNIRWIESAIERAVNVVGAELDVRLITRA